MVHIDAFAATPLFVVTHKISKIIRSTLLSNFLCSDAGCCWSQSKLSNLSFISTSSSIFPSLQSPRLRFRLDQLWNTSSFFHLERYLWYIFSHLSQSTILALSLFLFSFLSLYLSLRFANPFPLSHNLIHLCPILDQSLSDPIPSYILFVFLSLYISLCPVQIASPRRVRATAVVLWIIFLFTYFTRRPYM